MMKRMAGMLVALFLGITLAIAAGPKDYQVTGPVLDVTNDTITVEKDKDKWEIARTKDTKVTGDLKKGSRVTIRYTMTATSVEVKDAGKAKDDDKKKAK
jgi:RNase P/RNase MRP subunit p29